MKKLAGILLLATIAGCQPQREPMAIYWRSWGDQQLENWLQSSQLLESQASSFCEGTASLGQLQDQWRDTFLIWSGTNAYPFKGIADLTLEFELYFWPDRRNRVEGQLRQRIDQANSASPELLESRIAAEKGLAAIEWLAFSANSEQSVRCQLLTGTAEDYADKVALVAEYHQQNPVIQDAWLDATSTSQSNSISLNLLFAQITALQSRLNNSVDEDFKLLSNQAYGWRSNTTLGSFSVGLHALLGHMSYVAGRPELTAESLQELSNLISAGESLYASLPANRVAAENAPIEALAHWLMEVEALLQGGISRDFEVLIGFNNFDGD